MAQLSRNAVIAAIVAANGKMSAQQIADQLGCEKQNIVSHRNTLINGVKSMEKIVSGNPLQKMDDGKGGKILVSEALAKIHTKYGSKLEKLSMNDTRGRKKMSLSEAFCLDEFEFEETPPNEGADSQKNEETPSNEDVAS